MSKVPWHWKGDVLIACACWDTPENGRWRCTQLTIDSLLHRVNFERHRIVIVDNGSTCPKTKNIIQNLPGFITVIRNETNIGTAMAINKAWALRKPGEHCGKVDNDVVVHQDGWADDLEEVIARSPKVGIACLKRKDLEERPDHEHAVYKSRLIMLPHERGQRWIVVEQVFHCMGTVQCYNSALLDKIGDLYQMQDLGNLYGFDDSLAAARCYFCGFMSVFIPHIPIDHVDPGGDAYTEQKRESAGKWLQIYEQIRDEYILGTRPVYWKDV